MNWSDLASQLFQTVLAVPLAPLLLGWVNQCRAWLQNRSGPGVLQPYRVLFKLLQKDAVLAHNASWLFRLAPYVVFGCMVLAVSIVPLVATDLPFSPAADVIALVGLFALARVFMALAAMDVGTAFGSLGARREMLIASLAEPALLMVFFTPALISQSTALTTIVEPARAPRAALYPSMAFAAVAFLMVLLAENARIPVDNPATHLELTMVHEAMILEYSARHLALMEWAHALKLMTYAAIGIALFAALGHRRGRRLGDDAAGGPGRAGVKLALAGAGLALLEMVSAKMRIFRAPEFLGMAFMLAVLGMLTHFLVAGMSHRRSPARLINLLASLLLLIAFAMLSQRRILRLIHLFALQGFVLALNTAVVAATIGQPHLYFSALLTLVLKVMLLPWILHRLIDRLQHALGRGDADQHPDHPCWSASCW